MAPPASAETTAAGPSPRLRICAGPRLCEARLLDALVEQAAALGERALKRPILVVVPSRSLRSHLLTRVVERFGRAVLGLTCRTHHHVAVDLVERSGGAAPVNDELTSLLARRFARREPALERALGHLQDGYAAVTASVRDLLDAGLEPAHREALEEALAAEGPAVASRGEIERAASLVRAAAATSEELDRLGVATTPSLLRRATGVVLADAAGALAPSALHVFGFSDATGVTTDFLEALVGRYGGTLYLDHPPDPAAREVVDAGVAFTRRFAERMGSGTAAAVREPETAATPRIEMFRAAGAGEEIREVARRLRALLDRGVPAERIGVVGRRLGPYRTALREHLGELGVPFSGLGVGGPPSPDGRRLRALADLLRQGPRLPVERWLEIHQGLARGVHRHLLRHALLSLGAGRLEEVAELRFEGLLRGGAYRLSVGLGFGVDDGDESSEGEPPRVYLPRSRVAGSRLETARSSAKDVLATLRRLGDAATRGEASGILRRLIVEDLAWPRKDRCRGLFFEVLEEACRGLSPTSELATDELFELLEAALEQVVPEPLGGQGGGVQILEVIEARARTFDHLFVPGLNRGVFPRTVREDPALPDGLRHVLARAGHGVLPDLPLKLGGHQEERYLFAQLLDAAPRVTLSWQEVDDDGAQLTPSPLVERLRWSADEAAPEAWREPPMAPHLYSLDAAPERRQRSPRPAREEAILAGIFGRRDALAGVLAEAFAEAGRARPEARSLAATRVRLLDEIDPVRGTADGERTRGRLGPFFGLLGAAGSGDPRGGRLSVTRLEGMATCPWKVFLEKILRIEAPADPLEVLPGIDGRLVGNLVHRILERLIEEQIGGGAVDLDDVFGRLPLGVPWPAPEALDALALEAAEKVVLREGIALPGFARALVEVVRPHLEVARRLDWPDGAGAPAALAVEIAGEAEITDESGARRAIYFKADRADREGGGLSLTDYKTGRLGIAESGSAATRRRKFLEAVGAGERLQAVAYALARGGAEDTGRYLFLNPALAATDEARRYEVTAAEEDFVEAFHKAARTALAAWDRGLFFPRLVEVDHDRQPRLCAVCDVAEACLRGDSAARTRLREWAERRRASDAPGRLDERTLVELWRLPARPRRGARSGR